MEARMKEQREGFRSFMALALDAARAAAARGEVPVGAIIVRGGEVVGTAGRP
jgi:cytidine deaminase